MRKLRVILLATSFVIAFSSTITAARPGDILASYDINVKNFLLNAPKHLLYVVDDFRRNRVIAINTQTLKVTAQTVVGKSPIGMALSEDGTKLYVANTRSSTISVLDPETLEKIWTIETPYNPYDIAVGPGGRLYVTQGNDGGQYYHHIMELDPITGKILATFESDRTCYTDGKLAISPDHKTLYFASRNIRPCTMAKYDISAVTPKLLWKSERHTLEFWGDDLAINSVGDAIYVRNGRIPHKHNNTITYGKDPTASKIRTSDMTEACSMKLDDFSRAIAISPDGKLAYIYHDFHDDGNIHIDVFDTGSCSLIREIPLPDKHSPDLTRMIVDETGTKLFICSWRSEKLRVCSTGVKGLE